MAEYVRVAGVDDVPRLGPAILQKSMIVPSRFSISTEPSLL